MQETPYTIIDNVDRTAWLEARSYGIGGSDASAIMGMNPYKNNIELFEEKTGRRITFEYTLVNGINDRGEDMHRLADLLSGMPCHVNLIPLNKVDGSGFDTVSREKAVEFQQFLERRGIPATVRRELGADIDAACGQLRLGQSAPPERQRNLPAQETERKNH